MKPILYLSGPMTGKENFNYGTFNAAAAELRKFGVAVFSPTEIFGGDDSLPYETYIAIDLAAVGVVDAIITLPDYETSRGALREIARAAERGIPIMSLEQCLARLRAGKRITRVGVGDA